MLILYVFIAVVVINCGFYLLFSKFSFLKSSEKTVGATPPVSLIVCAKNEEENLKRNIPLLLKQDYPNFELILINDASSDESLEVMEAFAETDPRIQIVNVKNNEAFWANKKYALTLGIKRAMNERLLFTDADCKPSSSSWLRIMTSHFSEEKQLILGYGAYEKGKGLLNKLIRFETLMTATQYFSYAKAGIPYMGVGRNLGFTSTLYYSINGYMSHIKVPSGDDDLFVNEAGTSKNTAICFDENAFTYSLPKKKWQDWKMQKRRHITTSKLYKTKHKLLLGTYYFTNLLFWILMIVSLMVMDWKIPVIIVAFRFIVQFVTVGKAAYKLKEKDLVPFIPFLELFLVFIQLIIFISNRFSKPPQWK